MLSNIFLAVLIPVLLAKPIEVPNVHVVRDDSKEAPTVTVLPRDDVIFPWPTVKLPSLSFPLPTALPTTGLSTIALPSISLPTTGLPSISLPTIALPTTALPSISLPTAALPSVSLPHISLPSVTLPSVALPSVALPSVSLPTISLPNFSLPTADLPTIGLPTIGLPTIGLPTISLPPIGLPTSIEASAVTPHLPDVSIGPILPSPPSSACDLLCTDICFRANVGFEFANCRNNCIKLCDSYFPGKRQEVLPPPPPPPSLKATHIAPFFSSSSSSSSLLTACGCGPRCSAEVKANGLTDALICFDACLATCLDVPNVTSTSITNEVTRVVSPLGGSFPLRVKRGDGIQE